MPVSAAACGPSWRTRDTLFIIIVQGDDVQQEEEGPARKPPLEDDDFLTGSDADDRCEPLDAGAFHEGRTHVSGFRAKHNRQFSLR